MQNIIIFSGEDIIASRKAFIEKMEELKENDFEIIKYLGKELSKNILVQNLESLSLFGKKRALSIENYLSSQKSKEKEDIIEYLGKNTDGIIVFWESKEFSKVEQTKFPGNFIVHQFKVPQLVFSFLDQISTDSPQKNLEFFHQALPNSDENFIFQMLIRQFRLLIMAKDPNALNKLAPWQKSKIIKQATGFSMEKLNEIFHRLLQIDFEQKTSASAFNLKSSLDLLLTEI